MATATAQAPSIPSVSELAAMPASSRESYFQGINDPDARKAQRAQYRAYCKRMNQHFLEACFDKRAVCPPATGGGGANSQNWSSTSPMVWMAPVADGAFIRELEFQFSLTVTTATTGGTFSWNAGAPYNLVQDIIIELNNTQVKVPLLLYKYLSIMRGYNMPAPGQLNSNANLSVAAIRSANYTFSAIVTGANTVTFRIRVPLNNGHRKSAAGILPSMSDSTRAKITLVPSSALLGPDPIISPVSVAGGSGNSVTVAGTVKCEAIYQDGSTLWSDRRLRLLLDEEPTVQQVRDLILQPLGSGTIQRQKLSVLNQHYYVISIVVDGQQSTKFATEGNLQYFALDRDQVGANHMWAFGSGQDCDVIDFYNRFADAFGTDLDEGVIPWVFAPVDQTLPGEAGLNDGIRVLNMRPGGYVNMTHAYQVGAVGAVSGITPRVETYLVTLNPDGLRLLQS